MMLTLKELLAHSKEADFPEAMAVVVQEWVVGDASGICLSQIPTMALPWDNRSDSSRWIDLKKLSA
jgi:hypothetical protein